MADVFIAEKMVDDTGLSKIAFKCVLDPFVLASELGTKPDAWERIKHDFNNKAYEMKYKLLIDWLNSNDHKTHPTYGDLRQIVTTGFEVEYGFTSIESSCNQFKEAVDTARKAIDTAMKEHYSVFKRNEELEKENADLKKTIKKERDSEKDTKYCKITFCHASTQTAETNARKRQKTTSDVLSDSQTKIIKYFPIVSPSKTTQDEKTNWI